MLLKCDASQLEWRVLAWLSNDPVAIDELNRGVDFHSENQRLFNLPSRLVAKIYLFRTIYRGSGWAFSKDPAFMHVSDHPDFWDDLNYKFYSKYRGIDRCHTQWGQIVAAHKPIISPLGREWMIKPRDDGKLPWTLLTNYPVQWTGNDLMAIARVSLLRRLWKNYHPLSKPGGILVSTVHDDIKMDCESGMERMIAKMMFEVFDDIPKNLKRIWGIDLPIQFPCDISVGPNLKDLTKLNRDDII